MDNTVAYVVVHVASNQRLSTDLAW